MNKFGTFSVEELFKELDTSEKGLAEEEAARRLEEYGPNELAEIRKKPLFYLFTSNFIHLFAILLWVGGILAFVGEMPQLGWAIFAVIIINAVFSFWQEFKAEKATEALKRMLPSFAKVIRDGEQKQVLAEELVPGDLIMLEEGDRISADCRLVEGFELRVDNSVLTGESEPVRRSSDAFLEQLSVSEIPNLVFAGTSVASGTGRAVAVATGMSTQFGKIAQMAQAVPEEKSPLQLQMEKVTRLVAVLAVGLGVVFFFIGRAVGFPLAESFLFAVGIIVANVPEGLLPTVTLALAMGVQRMAGRNALVKKLSSVETLGSTTVICTDKTGTLTQNEMTVREIWAAGREIKVGGVGYDPTGSFSVDDDKLDVRDDQSLSLLWRAASFCNNARLLAPDETSESWRILGDPTEAALLVAARKGGFDVDAEIRRYPRFSEIPFESKRKRMSAIHFSDNGRTAYVKGAPREVLDLCTHIATSDGVRPITEEDKEQAISHNDEFARQALRVLAMAYRELPEGMNEFKAETVEQELTFVGLMAMMDPPRDSVAAAVKECHRAGIRIIMITGDYGLTAESVARRIGIVERDVRIITGVEIDKMTDDQLSHAIYETEVIFARVAPEHKMKVVSVLKEHGEVVAVTGDGVNDAPALKRADIGVAMGIAGTDVAKEAADMILTDDNFASIVYAIEEGRAVFDNIRKFITYIFASNIPEIVPFILMAVFKIPLPLTVMQILAVDLGTDLLPALALGTELPEPGVMDRPPRPRTERLLNSKVLLRAYFFLGPIQTMACMAGFFFVFIRAGWSMSRVVELGVAGAAVYRTNPLYMHATTMTHTGIITTQIGNGFACRTERISVFKIGIFKNRFLLIGIAVELMLAILFVYVKPFQTWFEQAPLDFYDWLFLLAWVPSMLVADEARKAIVRWRIRAKEAA